ncbi:MAG: CHASE3 domain-containing protein [Chitinophagaceae bacterium]|nr:CHASE3 domain-containing protein [Chitinophagaceae bacterium]
MLLLLSYLLTFYTNRQLSNQIKSIDRTNTIINNLEKMLSVVKDAETGVRGYVITKRLDFLSPYQGSQHKTDSLHNLIALLTRDNAGQHEKVMRLKEDIDKRFEILNFAVTNFNSNNKELTDTLKKLQSEVKNVMDKIRTSVFTLQQNENASLIEREEKIQTTINTMNIIVITSLVLAIALVIFGVITFFKQNNERKKGLLRIKNYQIELDNRIKELNKANEELIQMRSIEKFAATGRIARTIAHEVRNPLTNINLAADQLKAEITPDDENARFLFDMIHRNSNRINLLISDLLNSTKFSDLNYEKVSINTLLDEALEEAKDRVILNNTKVVKKYSTDICEVSVDKTKIKIALLNIIINAIEAMENAKNATLLLETRGENNKCYVVISDVGTGMDKDSISRLFEPYFTNKLKGNGLGLTNTQNIILNHKGDIQVKSEEGKGTTFTIILNFAT